MGALFGFRYGKSPSGGETQLDAKHKVRGKRIRVRGQVQGVGFRPFVWQLATDMGLAGDVLNDGEGVLIHVTGQQVERFIERLTLDAPPLASLDSLEVEDIDLDVSQGFVISASGLKGAETRVVPDAATCLDCLQEIRSAGRRSGYAFTNCTNCGPRFSILKELPYDRDQTTMASFHMCPACRAEYEDPHDRRFHAQPIACPDCGPRLSLRPEAPDPLEEAARRLQSGEILAIKGLGGFHLACDATNSAAVALLRTRKHRPTKPLALMAPLDIVQVFAHPTAAEIDQLQSPSAPIVLIERTDALSDAIAPGVHELGWMLPYTPLHHLLCDLVRHPLVMTSGNVSSEPQVVHNDEAVEKLSSIADAILMHDREIARRLDDSVLRVGKHGPMILRRARGFAPGTLPFPEGFVRAPDVTAYGAHLKSALCLTKNGQALLSHHLGDLDHPLTWEEFLKADKDYSALFDHQPAAVACDLHGQYRSSQHAASLGLPLIEVQHHHAHLAACLAENLWPSDGGKVAGIVLDGLGLGTDGTIWGGEVLLGDYQSFERRAWLKPAPLPGGDAANREPWRNLLARLDQCGRHNHADERLADKPIQHLRMAIANGTNAPLSSSVGRLFDAVAAHIGVAADRQSFEGEAAMQVEAIARRCTWNKPQILAGYAIEDQDHEIDPSVLFTITGEAADIAMGLHVWLAEVFAARARALVAAGEAKAVALTGGCFQNALLLELTVQALGNVPVLVHRLVPANDGGLALGQALIAQSKLLRS